jgi:ACS family glucarate transporter-like MFS transporter
MGPPDSAPASRARYVVVLWLCGMAGVLYIDRICMGQAAEPIQRELRLSDRQLSYVAMAFTLAYGLFEVPTGRLGDRFGGRRVLTRVALWWSLFTALTGVASGLGSLLASRVLFGAGEAGAFPNAARVIKRWFPLAERGRVQGLLLTASQLGSVVAPTLAAYVIEAIGWRLMFAPFAVLGVAWAVGFWWWFRDDPAAHPAVNQAELAHIRAGLPPEPAPGPISWRRVLRSRGVLTLGVLMGLGSAYTYFFYSWYAKYLQAARDVRNVEAGWLTSLVMTGAPAGVFLGGFLADRITRRAANTVRARRYVGAACYLAAAACMFAGTRCDSALAMSAFFAASTFFMHLALPNWWSVAIPQGGRHVGALFGLMNGTGAFGALASQYFVGEFASARKDLGLTAREQWDPLLLAYVAVLLCGAVAWVAYRFRPLPVTAPSEQRRSDISSHLP